MQSLEGIRVLELGHILAAPFLAMMMGDMGADVIKIEPPGRGDESRHFGPPFLNGVTSYFLCLNRNKRSITLNLKNPDGAGVLRRLIEKSDVLVENFRPGSLAKLGFSYEAARKINPAIIYCSISGFGVTGPLADKAAFDPIVQGLGGVMSLTGPEEGLPYKTGVPIGDLTTAMLAAFAIVSALFHRQRTGVGQFIDSSLLDGQIALLTFQGAAYLATGEVPKRMGNRHPSIVPYQIFPTADRYINICVGSDALWERFCPAVGLTEYQNNPRFYTNVERVKHREELIPLIERRFKEFTTAELIKILEEAGVPCGEVATLDEVFSNPQVAHLNIVQELEHPVAGRIKLTAPPYRMSETQPTIRRRPPLLGEHTAELLEWLGYSEEHIAALRQSGAV